MPQSPRPPVMPSPGIVQREVVQDRKLDGEQAGDGVVNAQQPRQQYQNALVDHDAARPHHEESRQSGDLGCHNLANLFKLNAVIISCELGQIFLTEIARALNQNPRRKQSVCRCWKSKRRWMQQAAPEQVKLIFGWAE